MLGGAVAGLPTSAAAAASAAAVAVAAHKQFHPNSPPLDLESWKEAFLQQANNNTTNGNSNKNQQQLEQQQDASVVSNDNTNEDGVSSTAGGAINLSSRPSSVPESQGTTQASVNPSTTPTMEPDSQEDQVKNQAESRTGQQALINAEDLLKVGLPSEGKLSPLQALFSPPGLQQMQQFLQQVANSGGTGGTNTPGGGTGGNTSFNPAQLHHLMQQQQTFLNHHQQQLADAGRKQLEQLMHQLQEQLQINLLQQTHLMQTSSNSIGESGQNNKGGNKTSQAMQQLQIQQQQLISQLQLVQQRLLVLPNFGAGSGNQNQQRKMSDSSDFDATAIQTPAANKIGQAWKENGNTSPTPKNLGSTKSDAGNKDLPEGDNPSPGSPHHQHPLFQHGVCQWPGCDSNFTDLVSFLKHVGHEHILDDKSTAQARVQMQIVAQLEHSLSKERERLQAMMAHLHLTKDSAKSASKTPNLIIDRNIERSQSEGPPSHSVSPPVSTCENNLRPKSPPLKMRPPPVPPMAGPPPGSLAAMQQAVSAAAAAAGGFGHLPNFNSHGNIGLPPTPLSALTAAARGSAAAAAAAAAAAGLTHPPSSMANHIRRRMTEKAPPLPMSNGLPYMFDRAGLDIAQEIHRNREFYRTNDVRPPFTYASLIRQAVIESPERQLTLHEIYSWFTSTFAYFRRNAASWKNAIRTNLSLHKCFVRYEDDFGSFWMVDDAEFMKRRHLSRGRPRKYEPSANNQGTANSNANSVQPLQGPKLSQTEIGAASVPTSLAVAAAQFKMAGGSQAKSPSFAPSPSMYSEALNASLQSALGFAENNLPFLAHGASMASFHHHQQQREREEKQGLERPSSVEYASKLLGSNASSYLSPSSMSDTENNNNHDKLDDLPSSQHPGGQHQRPVSPLRLGRKRPASADLDTDHIIEDDHHQSHHRGSNESVTNSLHFKQRHPSAEAYNMSEVADQRFDFRVNEHSRSDSPIKEELSLKDISILRNPEESIKREKH